MSTHLEKPTGFEVSQWAETPDEGFGKTVGGKHPKGLAGRSRK